MVYWNQNFKGASITLQNDGRTCFLKEKDYVFRSIVANAGFNGGKHYWEIVPL